MTYLYKDMGFIRAESPQWEEDKYGHDPDGKGDLLSRTALFAMMRNDMEMLSAVYIMLKKRRRWPVEMDEPYGKEHRDPYKMTRDPYIIFAVACYKMGCREWLKTIELPKYIKRPTFTAWWNYMATGDLKYKSRYIYLESLSLATKLKMPGFVLFLSSMMAWAADSTLIQMKLERFTPEWNLAVRQLIEHPSRINDIQKIKDYQPQRGFVWQSDTYYSHKKLPEGEEYYQDKEFLLYVYHENVA